MLTPPIAWILHKSWVEENVFGIEWDEPNLQSSLFKMFTLVMSHLYLSNPWKLSHCQPHWNYISCKICCWFEWRCNIPVWYKSMPWFYLISPAASAGQLWSMELFLFVHPADVQPNGHIAIGLHETLIILITHNRALSICTHQTWSLTQQQYWVNE